MEIINCPECDNQISNEATSCPNCGYVLKKVKNKKERNQKKENKSKIRLVFIIVIVIGALVGGVIYINYYNEQKAIEELNLSKANEVIILINDIGEISHLSESSISNAEEAFGLLNDIQRQLVSNYDLLIDARETIDNLPYELNLSNVNDYFNLNVLFDGFKNDFKMTYIITEWWASYNMVFYVKSNDNYRYQDVHLDILIEFEGDSLGNGDYIGNWDDEVLNFKLPESGETTINKTVTYGYKLIQPKFLTSKTSKIKIVSVSGEAYKK